MSYAIWPPLPAHAPADYTCPCGLPVTPDRRNENHIHLRDCPYKPITDTARLEWLITGSGRKHAVSVLGSAARGWSVCDCSNGLVFMSKGLPTWREAIDVAMARAP